VALGFCEFVLTHQQLRGFCACRLSGWFQWEESI
jgi:hypothetical protein